MREKYQPQPDHRSTGRPARSPTPAAASSPASPPAPTTDLMDDAWWGPTIPLPRGPWFCLAERNLPGSIIVNSAGRRFMNEALPYVEAVHEIYKGEATGVAPRAGAGWSSTSATATATCSPGSRPRQPFPGRWYKHGTVKKAATARRRSPTRSAYRPTRCSETVERFNGFARDRRRRGLPPRRERLRQVLLRPHREAEPVAARDRPGARSTPSRSCPATSAPRAAWSPTSAPGCCARTAR